MSDWKLPWEGGCLCGQTRLRVTEAPLFAMACHCKNCQRLAASAFSLTLMVPQAGFHITKGEPVVGGLHGENPQLYCPHCKSWMFTRIGAMADIINLRPSMLDEHAWFAPFVETGTQDKLPWAQTPALHSFEDMVPPERYQELTADYAKRGARP